MCNLIIINFNKEQGGVQRQFSYWCLRSYIGKEPRLRRPSKSSR
ncbi:hypothetical protein Ahy_B04g070809 isoform C [Arachis hypogaea]|uniref:Uncharacterized protein n=1 Tax=Arachis hypogaea TaxID=3818 RepID=A0A444ZJ22_ARAHY|nr:hypothetical protein Ahy_B04g070809 isoform C [Arachis hypogaea]